MSFTPYETESHEPDTVQEEAHEYEETLNELPEEAEGLPSEIKRGILTRLKLECVLSGISISLNDLHKLENGHVLTIPQSPWNASVDLRLGGESIGRGRLTSVNDLLAVQVMETYVKGESTNP